MITVAPLGIVFPSGILRTCSSSAAFHPLEENFELLPNLFLKPLIIYE